MATLGPNRFAVRKGIDLPGLFAFLALVLIGWFTLFAASYDGGSFSESISLDKEIGGQTLWLGIGLISFILCFSIDWKFWSGFSYIVYATSLFLLLLVLIIGSEIKGAKSWFIFMGFSFQPSEFAKLGTCLALASYLGSTQINASNVRHFIYGVVLIFCPILLVLLQPDAGSAMVFSSLLIVLYIAGASRLYYLVVITLMTIIITSLIFGSKDVIIWTFIGAIGLLIFNFKLQQKWVLAYILLILATFVFNQFDYKNEILIFVILIYVAIGTWAFLQKKWKVLVLSGIVAFFSIITSFGINWVFSNILKPHQQDRINVWLRPDLCDPRGSLYNIIQSKIAIGSGGITGTGFLQGAMTKLDFVPEQNTDFIFCTIGEEQGFLGVFGVIFLFGILMIRLVIMAERARINFIKYYIYGVLSIFLFHVFVNIGMTLGLMPVVGIPLPLMSKGGSSLLVFFLLFGIVFKMDLARHR